MKVPAPPVELTDKLVSTGIDYYKPTMSQLQFEKHLDAEVTFTLHNRGRERLLDYIDINNLGRRLESLASGWQPAELAYLAGLKTSQGQPMFAETFLTYLGIQNLPPVELKTDPQARDLAITSTGPWPLVTFWETLVMSEVNEAYIEGYLTAHGLDAGKIYDEGDRRLSAKIA